MLRSQTVNTIQDFDAQGKMVQEIAQELNISRTTVRKYLKHPEAVIAKPRPPRPSKLDRFKEQINKWVMEDHCTNCEVLFERLQKLGYTGGISILKEYVDPLRLQLLGMRRFSGMRASQGSKSNSTGENLSTSMREKPINSTALSLFLAILACAS